MRRAVFRARRRDIAAALMQRSNRRGATFHRIHGASSQALRARSDRLAAGKDTVLPVIPGLHQSSSAEAELRIQIASPILAADLMSSALFPVTRKRREAGDF